KQWGRHYVMGFRRWGMQSAQPEFAHNRHEVTGADGLRRLSCDRILPAAEMVRYEVAPNATRRADQRVYRADINGIRNPDATFIEHSRADIDWLIAEVERLKVDRDCWQGIANQAERERNEANTEAKKLRAAVAAVRELAEDVCGDDDRNDTSAHACEGRGEPDCALCCAQAIEHVITNALAVKP